MVSGRGAKAKGDNYERELAAYINKTIFHGEEIVSRTPLSGGGVHTGKADLEGLKYLSVEAKRTEKFSPHAAMRQAEAAAGEKNVPVVITRKSNVKTGDSWVMLKLSDFLPMYRDHLRNEKQREHDAQDEEEAREFYQELLANPVFRAQVDEMPGDTFSEKLKAMMEYVAPTETPMLSKDSTWLHEWKTGDE